MSAALEAAARREMLEGDPALAWSLGRAIVAERRLGEGSGDAPEYYRLGDGLDVGDVLEALGWAGSGGGKEVGAVIEEGPRKYPRHERGSNRPGREAESVSISPVRATGDRVAPVPVLLERIEGLERRLHEERALLKEALGALEVARSFALAADHLPGCGGPKRARGQCRCGLTCLRQVLA